MKTSLYAPLALLLAGLANADVHVMTASLDGAQAVPPVTTNGSGTATVTVDDVTGYVHVQGTYAGMNGSEQAIHLHGPAPAGSSAGLFFALSGTGGTDGSYEGSATLTPTQVDQILDGLSYVNIHTSTSGGGELRGQALFPLVTYTGDIDGAQAGVTTTGTGTYTATIDRNNNEVTVSGTYSNLMGTVNAAHLHGSAWYGQGAGLFFGLPNSGGSTGTFTNTATLTDAQVSDMLAGFTYVNIHTTAVGAGEIRGQVISNTLGTAYCQPTLNSANLPGTLIAVGSPRAVDADVTLMSSNLPPNSFGYVVTSQSSGQTFPVTGSQGRICVVGPNIGRLVSTLQNSGSTGTFSAVIDITSIPGNPPSTVMAGDSWSFQTWHRDAVAGTPTSNFTNAVSISFR